MNDVRIPEHLKDPRRKDNKSSAVGEPKADNKSKIKIRPPGGKKIDISNKNNDKFIDRNILKNKKSDKTDDNKPPELNKNKLVNMDSKDTDTEIDNSMVHQLQVIDMNKTNEHSEENHHLINEYNQLLEANKKIFSELKGDKEYIEQHNSELENQNHMMFSNSDL